MTELNREELLATLEWMEAHPEQVNMGEWCDVEREPTDAKHVCMNTAPECGTTACFAGWHVLRRDLCIDYRHEEVVTPEGQPVRGRDGSRMSVPAWAAEDLGLNGSEKARLFYATGNDEIRESVELILAGEFR